MTEDLLLDLLISILSVIFPSIIFYLRIYSRFKNPVPTIFFAMVLYFIINLYWLYNTGWYLQLSIMIIILATLHTLPLWFLWKREWLLFIVSWITIEYILLHSIISFPILSLGHHLAIISVDIIQFYEFTGILGGTLAILMFNVFLIQAIINKKYKPIIGACLLFTIVSSAGIAQANHMEKSLKGSFNKKEFGAINTRLKCPEEKYNKSIEELSHLYVSLTNELLIRNHDLEFILWPETALSVAGSHLSLHHNTYIQNIARNTTKDVSIMTGAILNEKIPDFLNYSPFEKRSSSGSNHYIFNSILHIPIEQNSTEYRHKYKLVPFNESLIFGEWSKPLKPFLDKVSMTYFKKPGTSRKLFNIENWKVAPIICYESLFGHFISEFTLDGANLIVMIFNEGWYYNVSGAIKFLTHAKIRAIENRKYVVGSSNYGFSYLLNTKGIPVSIDRTGTGVHGEVFLNRYVTFYNRFGDYIGVISIITFCIFLALKIYIHFI